MAHWRCRPVCHNVERETGRISYKKKLLIRHIRFLIRISEFLKIWPLSPNVAR
jgi:hypothetical protein